MFWFKKNNNNNKKNKINNNNNNNNEIDKLNVFSFLFQVTAEMDLTKFLYL